jgi:SSS family solute:Na+ symporter
MIYCLPFIFFLFLSAIYAIKTNNTKAHRDVFFLGSRSVTTFPLVMTFIGTQVGAGFILGTADVSYRAGLIGICYPLGLACGFLGLGLGFGAKIRALEISTISELYNKVFQSRPLQRLSSLLLLVSLSGISVALAVGMKKFLISLDLANPLYFIFCWILVVFYTSKGGLSAVIRTDVIQALALVLLLIITFLSTLPYTPLVIPQLTLLSKGAFSFSSSFGDLLFPFLFMFIGQDMAQRCFAAKTPEIATKATLISAAVLALLACIPVWFGILGNAIGVDSSGSIFLNTVQKTCSPVIFSFAASSVLLAIVSTVSSVLLAISSSISHDLFDGKYGTPATFVIGLGSLLGGFLGNDIIGCMLTSYELSAAALAPTLLISVAAYKRVEGRTEIAWAGFLAGTVGFVYQKVSGSSTIVPLICSTVATALAFYLPQYGSKLQKELSS